MRTSLRAVSKRNRTRGITLIEISVVVMVIVIMAALIERNFSRTKEGLAQRAFASDLRSEVIRGRLQAIHDGKTVTMQYDAAGSRFTLSEVNTDTATDSQTFTLITDMQSTDLQPLHSIPVPSSVTFGQFLIGTNDSSSGDWKLHFYPDGRCDSGGVQVMLGKLSESLVVDIYGVPNYVDGPLPDTSNDVWQAGTYEQRTTTG